MRVSRKSSFSSHDLLRTLKCKHTINESSFNHRNILIIDSPISNNLKASSPCITLFHNIIVFFAGPMYQKYVENFIRRVAFSFKCTKDD